MRSSKLWVRDRILLILDQKPCHGYELSAALQTNGDSLRLTTLYRWLHEMETEGHVTSKMTAGNHGPNRRVYRVGPRGETRLLEILKESIEVILHFYHEFRSTSAERFFKTIEEIEPGRSKGRILFGAEPWLKEQDIELLQHLANGNDGQSLFILGDASLAREEGIRYRPMKGSFTDIPLGNARLSEIWISGIPSLDILPLAIAECKRVLATGGVLRLIAPFAFFDEPVVPTISEFIRVTSVHLLPDVGIVEGNAIGSLFEEQFKNCGACETAPKLVVFWGVKE